MATPQNSESSRIIGSISKLAGALVGTVVVAGKRIVRATTSEGPLDKPKEKTIRAPAKRKKKAVGKTKTKVLKVKKKKAIKRKPAGSSGKGGASKKRSAQSPAKNKQGATPRKKTTHRKIKKTAKNKVSSYSQDNLKSQADAETNVPTGEQEPQLRN